MPAIQESTSPKELQMSVTDGGPSNLALENMLTNTQSLRSLSLSCPDDEDIDNEEDIDLSAARSGLKKNTTLRELTLDFSRGTTSFSSLFTSLRDHPSLRRLCLRFRTRGMDLTGLETVPLSETSKITELDICRSRGGPPVIGLTPVL
jgi:hypothetical protein